ncbi:hypothetical protein ZWY2020_016454 [Hordeum vulgare]|nr:hypothetical protein ZWY2020_016454 [Hordeum vulgare]
MTVNPDFSNLLLRRVAALRPRRLRRVRLGLRRLRGHDRNAEPPRQGNDVGRSGEECREKGFPLKSMLAMELNWYTSPEEAEDSGGGSTFDSDVYRLGVLLFEVLCFLA